MQAIDITITEVDRLVSWLVLAGFAGALIYGILRGIKIHLHHHYDEDERPRSGRS